MTFSQLQEKIQKNPSVDFGTIFSDALALFQKVWLQGFVMLLITYGVMLGVMFILYLPLLAGVFIMDGTGNIEPSGGASIIFLIGIFIFYVLLIGSMSFFTMGLQAAFYRQVRMKDRGVTHDRNFSWGMFFKKKYAKKLFLLSLATAGISIGAALLCVIPIFYVAVPLQFVTVIYAFNHELSLKEILSVSFNIGTKKWGVAFLLIIVSSLLAQIVGIIMCGIGILFTASFVFLPVYLVYKEVIGFYEDEDAIAQIGA